MNYLTFNELTSEEKVLFLAFCRIIVMNRESPDSFPCGPLITLDYFETDWECYCTQKSPDGYEFFMDDSFGQRFNDLQRSIVTKYLKAKNGVGDIDIPLYLKTKTYECYIIDNPIYHNPYEIAYGINVFRINDEIEAFDQLRNLYICNVNYPEGKYIKFYYYELPLNNMLIFNNVKGLIAHNVDENGIISVIANHIAGHILKSDYGTRFHYNLANLAPELAARIIADARMMYESLK